MYANANDAYLETRVLSAEPIELVRMLYQAASNATRDARRHLAAGDIAARSHSISKTCAVLAELTASLDRERGAEVAGRLAQLYDYMARKLIEANVQQTDEPLAEVVGLLATLSEAWDTVASGAKPPAPAPSHSGPRTQDPSPASPWSPLPQESSPASAWVGPFSQEPLGAATYSPRAWSL